MTDDVHECRVTCLKKQHFCSSVFRVSACTKFFDHGSCKLTNLLSIFSYPNFQTDHRNKINKRHPDNRITTLSSVLLNTGLNHTTENQKKQNTNYDASKKSFSLWNHFNISILHTIDSGNNFKIIHSSLSWLWNLFPVPKVYASDNETVLSKVKDGVSSEEGKEEKMRDAALEKDVLDHLSRETGWDRLRVMFSKDHTGEYSPEMTFISQVVIQSIAITFLFMSVIGGNHGKQLFVMQNKPTVYKTKFLAFRQMHDVVFLHSMKAGTKWAFKITMFILPFLFVSQSISVYRNKTSPLEYSVGGAVTGSILKFNLGPKGMFAGGVIGGFMGLVSGIVIWAGLKGVHQTQEERHFVQIEEFLQTKRSYTPKSNVPPQENQTIVNTSTG